ncbi:polysaccharide deacetylase family protein [Nakamurella lactea]|uniref:polysaccharide deacetylase family protein n=1 Tax=Nakamurella lactea TaxID=459515 RepID=UPI0003FE8DB1|nr:polysaccharide deacetylase family protein [Nakamurella lactea]
MADRLLNICFHGIGEPGRELEPGEDRYWIGVDQFHRILDEIATWRNVRISFDDGNRSDLEYGLPALVERDLHATFFVLAGRLGQPGSLAEDDVRALDRAGMTIGTHGMNHRPWRGMASQEREIELVEARERIADASGRPVDQAALPLGRYDRQLLSSLRGLGYTRVFSSDRRASSAGSWLQPRFSVRVDDSASSMRSTVLPVPAFSSQLKVQLKGVAKRLR